MTVLSVSGIGKTYVQYRNEFQRVLSWFGASTSSAHETEVIRDVSFEVRAGEALGIIGTNGAGKSTLLKIITGTLKQSKGQAITRGRVAAILELGMGFNPDLTGAENVFHSAGLAGFSREEIESKISEIEAFAEIGDYFWQPVRTYSSGMQARVAFAVATAWRPDILIVDEVLSVGDAYFQHKSFAKIRELGKAGTSLLIVSHDRNAIQSICDRVLLLDKGGIAKEGPPEEVFDFYNALISQKENGVIEIKKTGSNKVKTVSGTGEATVESTILTGENGEATDCVGVGENVKLRIQVKVHRPVESLVLGYGIKDRLGQVIFGTNTWHTKQRITNAEAGEAYVFHISFPANFGVGNYSVHTALVDRDTHLTSNYEWQDFALVFEVVNIDKAHFSGCSWNEPNIAIEKLPA